jgi:hypothetical protein
VKQILDNASKRWGYSGWGIRGESGSVYPWTVCTTRAECRALRKERADLFLDKAEIVKVKISVEAIQG